MKKTAIAFLSKDKTELSAQSVLPLLQPDKFNLFWIDGSTTPAGERFPYDIVDKHQVPIHIHSNVRGGAGAAMVFALTKMLEAGYEQVGLVEQDVVLDPGWFMPALDLFHRGESDGLPVGAVTARTYADRVLFQRPDYSVMLNIGAGMIVFSREAAQIVLNAFRSGYTADNRRIFCQLSGVDLGPFWAFKNNDHNLVADWHFDAVLASHGLCSLGVMPSYVQMIGQNPPLAEQGLVIADGPVTERVDEAGFNVYRARLQALRHGAFRLGIETVPTPSKLRPIPRLRSSG